MVKKANTLNHRKEQPKPKQSPRLEDALKALGRLRRIGERLPAIDAATIVRESRDLTGEGSANGRY